MGQGSHLSPTARISVGSFVALGFRLAQSSPIALERREGAGSELIRGMSGQTTNLTVSLTTGRFREPVEW